MTLDEARALDAADPLRETRQRFRLPEGKIYLDGNSLGALPLSTAGRIAGVVEREWGDDLIVSWNKHHWIDAPSRIAAKLAPIVGAGADEMLIADSTSVNLFKLLAAALAARPGRTVILSDQGNFPADLYIAQGLARMLPGVTLRTVPADTIDQALDDQVAVLTLTQVDYRSGRRHDLAARTAAAHRAGALTLWDLSHSAGAIEIDLAGSAADMAVGCGYKYLNGGPGAPAWLFIARALQDQLDNPLSGWMGHADPFAFDRAYAPRPGIARFQTGTPSILAMTALDAGLDSFAGVKMAAIEAKARALTDYFIGCVEGRCPALALASPRDAAKRGSHVVFAHADAYAVMQALIERGVIGDFRAPDLIRFGFAPLYNGFDDAWRAADALSEVLDRKLWDVPRFKARARVT
ncbi:MAG: kynureninase [Sphingomonas sp.]|uniref:kynureninase n=1 Tax=Sphingomonas sp. TaxID=28214 RepID=UPI00182C8D2A|nr:kynureninase [Sphingomonas sp.]MBA3666946.1 kynureninase [Sphingomonas sp.]